MIENSNKAIVINTILLYIKLLVSIICGLFITRYSLKALGVMDYGLYSVIGSIITFFAIINTIMISTSQRYLAVSIGKSNNDETNKQFNICLTIHIFIALITVIIALPLGIIYINNYLNYDGDFQNAIIVFTVSLFASAVSFVGVPYNGLLSAKEKFIVFCIPDIISHIIRLLISIFLIYFIQEKLLFYSFTMAFLTIIPNIVYFMYCNRHYSELVKFKYINDWNKYKEIFNFSTWVGYGAIAYISKSQGAAILINMFYNTIMNTAFGIANSLSAIIIQFAQSVAQPIAPQITKTYVSGNRDRCDNLLVLSTKLSFLVMLLISSPFLIECEWIIELWIGFVPDYAVSFTILLIIDALIDSMNSGIKNIIFADGNIKLFQIIPSTLKFISIIIAFVFLNLNYSVCYLLYTYIFFSIVIVVANQIILYKTVCFDNMKLIKGSYLPSIFVTTLFIPLYLIPMNIHPICHILLSMLYLSIIIIIFGLDRNEKKYLLNLLKVYKNKKTK